MVNARRNSLGGLIAVDSLQRDVRAAAANAARQGNSDPYAVSLKSPLPATKQSPTLGAIENDTASLFHPSPSVSSSSTHELSPEQEAVLSQWHAASQTPEARAQMMMYLIMKHDLPLLEQQIGRKLTKEEREMVVKQVNQHQQELLDGKVDLASLLLIVPGKEEEHLQILPIAPGMTLEAPRLSLEANLSPEKRLEQRRRLSQDWLTIINSMPGALAMNMTGGVYTEMNSADGSGVTAAGMGNNMGIAAYAQANNAGIIDYILNTNDSSVVSENTEDAENLQYLQTQAELLERYNQLQAYIRDEASRTEGQEGLSQQVVLGVAAADMIESRREGPQQSQSPKPSSAAKHLVDEMLAEASAELGMSDPTPEGAPRMLPK